ncbi:type II secretion system protein GspH [Corticibacter populi]|uniref:Type II secretion system protein GspH n=2 Tax=Corticibacter populi TaxID=1550736 RepID=A0A3M6QPV1_9BURK|nr:type II secretion system protein GspH [Corticibacter populi]
MRGFTLMEITIVAAIIGIGAAVMTLAWPDGGMRALEREGDRLAALLESARTHSRSSGQAIQWRGTQDGFVFEGRAPHFIATLPSHWENDRVQALAGQPLLLGPEPLLPAQSVLLTLRDHPEQRIRVATNGLLPFRVEVP